MKKRALWGRRKEQTMAKMYVNPNVKKGHLNPELQGHFSEHLGRCIYEGIYVGENSEIPNVNGMRTDVVEALKEIHVPVLRWPGGCFADEYHWRDGIGPKAGRKSLHMLEKVSRLIFLVPRSIFPIKFILMRHFLASSSCDQPFAFLIWRILAPTFA